MRLIYVDVKKRRFVAKTVRGQGYYWVAKGENGKRMSRSYMFTNKGDCYDSIDMHFGGDKSGDVTVFRREAERGNVLVRQGVEPNTPKPPQNPTESTDNA